MRVLLGGEAERFGQPAAHVALSGLADAAPNVVKPQAMRCMPCCAPASAAFSASVWMMGPGSLTGLPLIETGADDISAYIRHMRGLKYAQGLSALTITDLAGYVSGAFPVQSGPRRPHLGRRS